MSVLQHRLVMVRLDILDPSPDRPAGNPGQSIEPIMKAETRGLRHGTGTRQIKGKVNSQKPLMPQETSPHCALTPEPNSIRKCRDGRGVSYLDVS